jgi:methylamine dehydrogenase accessory protein MauD
MMTWLILNSVGLSLVGGVLYLTLRQVGFVLNRVAPPGARSTPSGPRIGENLSYHLAQLTEGALPPMKSTLIVFGADTCSICSQIRTSAEELAKTWKRDAHILLVYDCTGDQRQSPLEKIAGGLYFKRDCHLRQRLGADFVPFGIAVDADGVVLGKGLVNAIGHLESLLELKPANGGQIDNQVAETGAHA